MFDMRTSLYDTDARRLAMVAELVEIWKRRVAEDPSDSDDKHSLREMRRKLLQLVEFIDDK